MASYPFRSSSLLVVSCVGKHWKETPTSQFGRNVKTPFARLFHHRTAPRTRPPSNRAEWKRLKHSLREALQRSTAQRACHREFRDDTKSSLLGGVLSTRSKIACLYGNENLRTTPRPAFAVVWSEGSPDVVRKDWLTKGCGATHLVLGGLLLQRSKGQKTPSLSTPDRDPQRPRSPSSKGKSQNTYDNGGAGGALSAEGSIAAIGGKRGFRRIGEGVFVAPAEGASATSRLRLFWSFCQSMPASC